MITRPEEVGLSSERLARVDDVMRAYVDKGKLPNVQTLISRRGQLVHHDCYGLADVEAGVAATPDTIYRIYSMTKPITSVGLMMLFEEGRFLLENPVHRLPPRVRRHAGLGRRDRRRAADPPARRPMTVHDVLTHMSGLTYGFHYQHPLDELYRRHGLGDVTEPTFDLAEGMARMASLPLLFDPGTPAGTTRFRQMCAAASIEVMSGQTLDVFLQERILGPLGMTDTAFHAPESDLARCSPLYVRAGVGADSR